MFSGHSARVIRYTDMRYGRQKVQAPMDSVRLYDAAGAEMCNKSSGPRIAPGAAFAFLVAGGGLEPPTFGL